MTLPLSAQRVPARIQEAAIKAATKAPSKLPLKPPSKNLTKAVILSAAKDLRIPPGAPQSYPEAHP